MFALVEILPLLHRKTATGVSGAPGWIFYAHSLISCVSEPKNLKGQKDSSVIAALAYFSPIAFSFIHIFLRDWSTY